jgi:hypothetical protein
LPLYASLELLLSLAATHFHRCTVVVLSHGRATIRKLASSVKELARSSHGLPRHQDQSWSKDRAPGGVLPLTLHVVGKADRLTVCIGLGDMGEVLRYFCSARPRFSASDGRSSTPSSPHGWSSCRHRRPRRGRPSPRG